MVYTLDLSEGEEPPNQDEVPTMDHDKIQISKIELQDSEEDHPTRSGNPCPKMYQCSSKTATLKQDRVS